MQGKLSEIHEHNSRQRDRDKDQVERESRVGSLIEI